jgi:hypothetical protein
MQSLTTTRDKRHRYKDWEDWKWFEDPYANHQPTDWVSNALFNRPKGVGPQPLPPFSPEPPVHTGLQSNL